jgi:hypothetical protein
MVRGGFVGLLDVLGFSNLVASDFDGDKIANYIEAIKELVEALPADVESVVFSDSIVLTTTDKTENGLATIAHACSRIMGGLLQKEIPIRGAIAYGDFYRSRVNRGVFIAGRAVVDAYNFQQKQDWVGIMLAPSARARVTKLTSWCNIPKKVSSTNQERVLERLRGRLKWSSVLQKYDRIPFKPDREYKGIAVVPLVSEASTLYELFEGLQEAIHRLSWLSSIAPSPAEQFKYESSIEWLQEFANRLDEVVTREIEITTTIQDASGSST